MYRAPGLRVKHLGIGERRLLTSASAALLLPAVLFVAAYNGIVFLNVEETGYVASLTGSFVIMFAVSFVLTTIVMVQGIKSSRLRSAARTLIFIPLVVLLLDVLSPFSLGIQTFFGVLALEGLVVAVLGLVAYRLRYENLLSIFALVAPIVLASSVYEHWAQLASLRAEQVMSVATQERITPLAPVGSITELQPAFEWPVVDAATGYKFALYDETDAVYLAEATTEAPTFSLETRLNPAHTYRWKFAPIPDSRGLDYRGWVSFDYARLARQRQGVVDTQQRFSGNVYHLVFDAYQRQAFLWLRDREPNAGTPFTLFRDFHTNSGKTWSAVPEMLRSRFYEGETLLRKWRLDAYQEGLFQTLFTAGARVDVYPHYTYFCYDFATICRPNLLLKAKALGQSIGSKTIIDLWFLKLLPVTVKRLLIPDHESRTEGVVDADWGYGFSISETIFGVPLTPDDDDNPYFSVLQFDEFLEDEITRGPTGQYVYLHSILPHGPAVVDAECGYIGKRPGALADLDGYLEQVRCVNSLIDKFLDRLESLGRLDDSLVIIQGDHGFFWHPNQLGHLLDYSPELNPDARVVLFDEEDSSTWPNDVVEVRSSAVLLIKFPGQRAFETREDAAQTVDLAPTVLEYFGIPSSELQGIPLQEPSPQPRELLYFAHNKIPKIGNPNLMSRYRRVDGEWVFETDITTRR